MAENKLDEATGYLNQVLTFMGHANERLERADRALAEGGGYDRTKAQTVQLRADLLDAEGRLRGILRAVEDQQVARIAVETTTGKRRPRRRPQSTKTEEES